MISTLRCQNFRCFHDTGNIGIAPLTLIVGENNSGKSSILQALRLLNLTLESADPNISLKLIGRNFDFGSYTDLVFKHDTRRFVTLSYGAEAEDANNSERREHKPPYKLHLEYGYLQNRKEIYLRQFTLDDSEGEWFCFTPDKYSGAIKMSSRLLSEESDYLRRIFERRHFSFDPPDPFETQKKLEGKYDNETIKKIMLEIAEFVIIKGEIISSLYNVQFLGPLRGWPNRTYLYSGEVSDTVGTTGESAFQTYTALANRKSKDAVEKVDKINRAMFRLGFLKEFIVRKIGSRHYELWTQHSRSLLGANLADTGFGASQVFPVVVSLFTSTEGSTLLFEQPEIH